jgi:hypothetical protein
MRAVLVPAVLLILGSAPPAFGSRAMGAEAG